MFYRTQIKSVTSGGVVDTTGRSLRFIGFLPVKAGDFVFTDGTFVFGNAPPKGAPAVFDEPSGIPVLGDFDSSGENELRGYFTANGRYKTYGIADDDWITNSKYKFNHGEETLNGEKVIDAEFDTDGKLFTAEKKITQITANDYDYHWGFYQEEATGIFAPISFGRIAVHVPGDNFYDRVEGFQTKRQADGSVRPFYQNIGGNVTSSYDDGFYWAFRNETEGLGINMATCYFFLKSSTLDYSMADNKIIRHCEIVIRQDDEDFQTVSVANLLTTFEDAAKAEVDLLHGRESVNHIKSRAIVHNFKIKTNGDWELLLEAEIWASNTFYNENDDIDHSTDPPTSITTPFHISSTVSHSHLLLKFNADGSYEKIWAWKFLYPLKLRDVTFGEYYDTEPELTVSVAGAWIIHTMKAELYHEDGTKYWRTSILHDYFSFLEEEPLEYDTPITESTDKFYFHVQDDYHATIIFDGIDEQYLGIRKFPPDNAGELFWKFGGVFDRDNHQLIGAILPDETNAHKWNMSFAPLKSGGFLFGIHKDIDRDIDGALYKIDSGGNMEQVGGGLKNFRLRELKKISKAKR